MDDALHGRSKMVVLPTAYGKSVCFQLPALLHPGMLMVICPLRALMQDQIESLRQNGIAGAATLSAVDDAMEKDAKLKRVSRGEIRLLYVSPERILVHSFVDEVARNASKWATWALAADEAHCVSEWGHDFRPAYLYIDRFRRRLAEHRPVAILALTATASLLERLDAVGVGPGPDALAVVLGLCWNVRADAHLGPGPIGVRRLHRQVAWLVPRCDELPAEAVREFDDRATAIGREESGRVFEAKEGGGRRERVRPPEEDVLSVRVDAAAAHPRPPLDVAYKTRVQPGWQVPAQMTALAARGARTFSARAACSVIPRSDALRSLKGRTAGPTTRVLGLVALGRTG